MSKSLLAGLLSSIALTPAAAAVAQGKPGLSEDETKAGTAELESLVAAAHEEGRKAGASEGRKAERERFGTVLSGEHAADNMGLAITLLSTTDNTPDQIAGALKASKPAAAAAPAKAGAEEQQQAVDPIAGKTPLVDTGKQGTSADDLDQKQVDAIWTGAIANVGGITDGGANNIWGGMDRRSAN